MSSDRRWFPLSVPESADAAPDLFEGDLRAAREWMMSPAFGLDSRAPLEMMGTRVEAQAVIDLTGRMGNGTLA
jgi:putative toxin-antitoxin system antitoxin component (TIGR02293 family)